MDCKKCKIRLMPQSKFCHACGSKVITVESYLQFMESLERSDSKSNLGQLHKELDDKFEVSAESTKRNRSQFQKAKKVKTEVNINVGIGHFIGKEFKPIRGRLEKISITEDSGADAILDAAVVKHHQMNKKLPETDYALVYKDGTRVVFLPDDSELFTLAKFKHFLKKDYQRITLYIVEEKDLNEMESEHVDEDKVSEQQDDFEEFNVRNDTDDECEIVSHNLHNIIDKPINRNPTLASCHTTTPMMNESFEAADFFNYDCAVSDEELTLFTENEVSIDPINLKENDCTPSVAEVAECKSIVQATIKNFGFYEQLFVEPENCTFIRILRRNLWENIKKKNMLKRLDGQPFFDWEKYIKIKFLCDDRSTDGGGLLREFSSLLMSDLTSCSGLFEGDFQTGFTVCAMASAVGAHEFRLASNLIVKSILQGGVAPAFFSKLLFNYIVGDTDNIKPTFDDVKHLPYREILMKTEFYELYEMSGCSKPISKIDLTNIKRLVDDFLLYYCVYRVKAQLDDFKSGFLIHGFMSELQLHQKEFKHVFCVGSNAYEADLSIFLNEMIMYLSEVGTNSRSEEEPIMQELVTFIEEIITGAKEYVSGGKNYVITPKIFLAFLTGSPTEPPGGWTKTLKVYFTSSCPQNCQCFPIVSTCAFSLTIPIHVKGRLDDVLCRAVLESPGFGRE